MAWNYSSKSVLNNECHSVHWREEYLALDCSGISECKSEREAVLPCLAYTLEAELFDDVRDQSRDFIDTAANRFPKRVTSRHL